LPLLGRRGATFQRLTYRVRAGDTLDAYQDIAAANRVAVGQQLWIPVPCSCNLVAGQPVVHFTYVVTTGGSVAGIAQEFSTTEETILAVNKMADSNALVAGQVLVVPLRDRPPLFIFLAARVFLIYFRLV